MKNYIETGSILSFSSPAEYITGDVVSVAGIVGIATNDAHTGQPLTIKTDGLFSLEKDDISTSFVKGQKCYLENGKITLYQTDVFVGVCWEDSSAFQKYVNIKLKAYDASTPNLVVVNSITDLPAAVAGVITIPSNGDLYYFTDVIDIQGNDIVLGNNSYRAASQELGGIANANVFIYETCTVNDFRFNNVRITIDAPMGAYDWTKVNIYDSEGDCIVILAADNVIFQTFGFINAYGCKIDGIINSFVLSPNCIFRSVENTTAVFFELTENAVINRRLRIQDSVFSTDFSGQTAIKVHASATIGIESFIIKTVRFTGIGMPVMGINGDDDKAVFQEVFGTGVINSTAIANVYMKNNATPTDVVLQNERYVVAGTSQFSAIAQKFVHEPSVNGATYISVVARVMVVQCSFTLTAPSNNVIGVYVGVRRNGNLTNPTNDRISESEVYITTSGTRPDAAMVQCLTILEEGDTPYLIVQNTSGTGDITVNFFNMIIQKAPL